MQSSEVKLYLLIRCEIPFPRTNTIYLVLALNATVAVRRVLSRQSQSEEGKEREPSVQVSQVLNPELPLNQSGKIRNVFVLHSV